MNILIVPGCWQHMDNLGDLAMAQTACLRIRQLWSDAIIYVFSNDPEEARAKLGDVQCLSAVDAESFFLSSLAPSRIRRIEHWCGVRQLLQSEGRLRARTPKRFLGLMSSRFAKIKARRSEFEHMLNAFFGADMLIMSGQGSMTDAFGNHTALLLNMLEAAQLHEIPTVLLGQGIGPITHKHLLSKCKTVFRQCKMIALREDLLGRKMLASMSVPEEVVRFTGDDAIELAYNLRNEQIGNKLGVNVRVASYAKVDSAFQQLLKESINRVTSRLNVPVVPVPISLTKGTESNDSMAISWLMPSVNQTESQEAVSEPCEVIARISQCRVVITGSYHAGVFALAQGIPVIGITSSEYYLHKWRGLSSMFGAGCLVIQPDSTVDNVVDYTIGLWNTAESLRPHLLEAASKQIQLSKSVYSELPTLLGKNQAQTPGNRSSAL